MTISFTCTSDALYDRHHYEIVLKNGKNVFFDNWNDVQVYWFTHNEIPDFLDFIVVKDKVKVKSNGFG